MKSEKEILKARRLLRKALDAPCDCAATGHGYECHLGAKFTTLQIDVLNWIIDGDVEFDCMMERLAARM